jgi:feruloyl esterase
LDCGELSSLQYPDTVFTSVTSVPEGALPQPGQTIPAHCLVTGRMFERVSPVDGSAYAIGFELRLPLEWNRRFFYQGNGGIDGQVLPAVGTTSGGGPLTSALQQGFAVISSDAGHSALQNPIFGIDPQARLDFGYQAVGKLTPMAKDVIEQAYGRGPAYSYIGGCSNGGRHALVAAARYSDDYDGYLVGSPGIRLPSAAVASIYGAQQYAPLSGGAVIPAGPFAGLPDLSAAFTLAERALLSNKVLERCDALDGAVDGMVQNSVRCQRVFDLDDDVPTCPGARDGSCLTPEQKLAVGNIFAGARTSGGSPIYSRFPFDAGHIGFDVGFWEFIAPLILDSAAVGFIFGVPPANPATFIPPLFALTGNIDQLAASTFATNATYTESAQSFMVPPPMTRFRNRRRMLVYHGVSDAIFSAVDTARWYSGLSGTVQDKVRLYLVPGMGHCSGGPATDQFDLLTPLMRWVERGEAPRRVIASARGATNPGGPNLDLPPTWSPDRTRPLCVFPRVAVYRGGDLERAGSFVCE